jgi:hypothetical protein
MGLFTRVSANVPGLVLQTVERLIAHWAFVGPGKLGLCWGDRSSRSGGASSNRVLHCFENKGDDKENKKESKNKSCVFCVCGLFFEFCDKVGWDMSANTKTKKSREAGEKKK